MKKHWVGRLLGSVVVVSSVTMLLLIYLNRYNVSGCCVMTVDGASERDCGGVEVFAERISDGKVWNTQADKQGRFSFRLPPGRYLFSPFVPLRQNWQSDATSGKEVNVPADEVKLVIRRHLNQRGLGDY